MTARHLFLLMTIAAPLVGAPAAALAGDKEATGVEVFETGIYRLRITGYTKAPKDIAGERFLADNVELFRNTKQILAQPKLTFGFGYRITDPALLGKRLTLELRFPEMTNPTTGNKATSLTDSFIAMPGIRRELFRFDHTWEMAEGIWTYRLLADGKLLATVSFKVFVGLN